jgi:hypothetical protein
MWLTIRTRAEALAECGVMTQGLGGRGAPPGMDAGRNGPMDAGRSPAQNQLTSVSSVSIGSSWLISERRCSQWGGMHMCVPSSVSASSIRKPCGVP